MRASLDDVGHIAPIFARAILALRRDAAGAARKISVCFALFSRANAAISFRFAGEPFGRRGRSVDGVVVAIA